MTLKIKHILEDKKVALTLFWGEGGATLHTSTNFGTSGDTEFKFYAIIDINRLFPKIEKQLG